jgi:hypothetical protein
VDKNYDWKKSQNPEIDSNGRDKERQEGGTQNRMIGRTILYKGLEHVKILLSVRVWGILQSVSRQY